RIFLKNIDNNLNLFPILHSVINKYVYLINKNNKVNAYNNGLKEKIKQKKSNNFYCNSINSVCEKDETNVYKNVNQDPHSNNDKCLDMDNVCENTCENGYIWQNSDNKTCEKINDIMHNLVINNNYVNIENICKSKLCFLKIENENNYDSAMSETTNDYSSDNKQTNIVEPRYNKTNINIDKKKKHSWYNTSTNITNCNKNKSKSCEHIYKNINSENISNVYSDITTVEEDDDDTITSTTTKQAEETHNNINPPIPPPINQTQFLINYKNIKIKFKHLDDLIIHKPNFIMTNKEIKKYINYYNEVNNNEIKNLYRILILSKLHIGVYNFLTYL
ncbi:riboflavin kinase, putative, partial [Hepatocystis sp. ex Piliocolobus tephrosceles]